MDSRKRFRSELSDKYIKSRFSRKEARFSRKKVRFSLPEHGESKDLETKFIQTLPEAMIKKPAQTDKGDRSYQTKINDSKPSREEVFKIERDNLKVISKQRKSYARGAQMLSVQIQPIERDNSLDVDDEQFAKKVQAKRKNYSKEYLQSFRHRADSLAADLKEKSRLPEVAHRIPKLAIEPGADEIAL